MRRIGMEYCLSADDGAATVWNRSPDLDLDGDGRFDAISLDLDSDGVADDALADLDGDGVIDHAVHDVHGAETYFTDDGSGAWALAAERPARAGTALRWFGLDGAEHTGGPLTEFGPDARALDSDGNGLADRVFTTGENGVTGYVDTDGDGRWDVKLTDTDGDGAADAAGEVAPPT